MIKQYLSHFKQTLQAFRWASDRTINSLKTAIACMLGYLLVLFSPLSQPQWIVITILVVMSAQVTFGGVLIKANMRFWGTLAGGLVAVSALLIGGNNPWWIAGVLLISALFFSYIAGSSGDISAAGVLGGVTVAVIVLNQHANPIMAGERLLEIMLGIFIAFIVSKYIFPIRAHTALLESFRETVVDLHKHFNRCLDDGSDNLTFSNIDLDEKISKSFQNQRKLIHELAFEPGKFGHQVLPFQKILYSLIKIYRFINMLYYSEHASEESISRVKAFIGFSMFQQQVNDFFLKVIPALPANEKQLLLIKNEFEKYVHDNFIEMVRQNKDNKIAAINAFLFAAKLLTQQLIVLVEMFNEVNLFKERK